jgi:hypothetical protein
VAALEVLAGPPYSAISFPQDLEAKLEPRPDVRGFRVSGKLSTFMSYAEIGIINDR